MKSFWLKLRTVFSGASTEEARNGFPFLASYPSSDARKCLAAFRSFAPADRVRLGPLIVMHQFRHELPFGYSLTPEDQALLTQMIARVQHVPMATLEKIADRPTRILAGWDDATWEASHVDVTLRRAKKDAVRRSVLKTLR